MNGGLARCVATETNWRLPLGALAPWARTENSCWQGGLKREGQSWADTDAKHRAECEQEVKQQELIVHCGAG